LELQEKIHTKTLNEFARERRALEDKIREQRRVLEQILSKSKEDKDYYVKIVRTMQKNQDDEAWAPKLLLSEEEKQSWNSRIFKAPVKTIVGGEHQSTCLSI
jgi:septal ring factor EnvC (AmiA/AmiB activator)